MIKIQNKNLQALYIGNRPVSRVYVGDNLVWPDTLSYLTFFSAQSFTLKTYNTSKNWDGIIEYSIDTINWNIWDGTEITSSSDNFLYLRGTGNTYITGGGATQVFRCRFVLTGTEISCVGDIRCLLNYINVEDSTMADRCFSYLFDMCSALIAAPSLPSTTLSQGCYRAMFRFTSIYSAPELPATTLAQSCYSSMFEYCSNLTECPILPATNLARNCYSSMFRRTSITHSPVLPATILYMGCYSNMFSNCTQLISAPNLPATILPDIEEGESSYSAIGCYEGMFYNCTSLSAPPILPATQLGTHCYKSMFNNCTNLKNSPNLPATELKYGCYESMFASSGLEKMPILGATTLAEACYAEMFRDCASLYQTESLPATVAEYRCYARMFYRCNSLVSPPVLSLTELADSCCAEMFNECIGLVRSPVLKATEMKASCYYSMFKGCTSLAVPPSLPATILGIGCYDSMFYGCTSLVAIPELPALNLVQSCYYLMFFGCTKIKISVTQTGEYQTSYRIPISGTGIDSTASSGIDRMFNSTGGTFTGNTIINTTYYTSNNLIPAS